MDYHEVDSDGLQRQLCVTRCSFVATMAGLWKGCVVQNLGAKETISLPIFPT